jgi:hypothetical protein
MLAGNPIDGKMTEVSSPLTVLITLGNGKILLEDS